MTPAGVGRRFVALVLDRLILGAFWVVAGETILLRLYTVSWRLRITYQLLAYLVPTLIFWLYFAIPESAADQTLARYLDESFRGRVVVGDRIGLGSAELVVREIEDGRITRVGLRLR